MAGAAVSGRWRTDVVALAERSALFPVPTLEVHSGFLWSSRRGFAAGTTSNGGSRCAPTAIPVAHGTLAALAVSFVGDTHSPAERHAILAEARRALVSDGTLTVFDHNRPRQRLAALLALLRAPRPRGGGIRRRWSRLSYAAAREVRDAGFDVERLRFAADERVQVIVARKPGHVD